MDAADLSGDDLVSGVATLADARRVAASVEDPELPLVTIEDLGILREVTVGDDGEVEVIVTPTYSGCPATEVIRDGIVAALADVGFPRARVRTVFSPPWTTDDITAEGRRKLSEAGIAPPRGAADDPLICPRCQDSSTDLISEFGSTACKALRVCSSCGEPFDHFKEI